MLLFRLEIYYENKIGVKGLYHSLSFIRINEDLFLCLKTYPPPLIQHHYVLFGATCMDMIASFVECAE